MGQGQRVDLSRYPGSPRHMPGGPNPCFGLVGPRQTCRANRLWPHLFLQRAVSSSRRGRPP